MNEFIKQISFDSVIIDDIIASKLYNDVSELYSTGIVIKDEQWRELCKNHNIDFDFDVVNKIFSIHNEIETMLKTKAYSYIKTVMLDKEYIPILDIYIG